ncbi:MAG: hypothetical protein V3S32_03925 [Acidimicrobiia bacterium]
MIFDPPPRRRAVARYFLLIVVGVAVVVGLIVSASGDETRAELDYLEEMQSQAVEISKGGDALRDVVSRLQRIDRTEFVTVIDGIMEDLAVGLAFVEDAPPTPSLTPVRSMYRQVLRTWEGGVEGYGVSVLEAADSPDSLLVVDTMADSLAELRAGDTFYADLVVEMRRIDIPNPLTPMPAVVLMPAEGSLVSLSVSYIDSARSPNSGLALRPGLAVSQIVSDPEWQVDPSDQVVVPITDSIVFSVVVTNVGNVASGVEALVLTLTGGPEQIREQAEVAALQPNQQVTIIFDALEVESGGIYEVAAILAITGDDSNANDNEIRVQFTVIEG